MGDSYDIAIIGGGAAGLAAAIFAAEANTNARVCILDGAKSLGAKILVSGGGRCNVTHELVEARDFNGPRNLVRNVLAAFDEKRAVEWFASMGVVLKREETGKLFPVTDSSRTVLEALVGRCRKLGVEILTERRVTKMNKNEQWEIEAGEKMQAQRVIVATGGKSLPKTGSDGSGYALVRSAGHSVTEKMVAGLVPLVCEESFFHAGLAGVAVEAELKTVVGGKVIDQRSGALLFTHFGISGPVVMDASRHLIWARANEEQAVLRGRFWFGDAEARLRELVVERNKAAVVNVVGTMVPPRLAEAIVKYAGVAEGVTMSQLSKEGRRGIARALTELEIPVLRDRGWNYAEVTAGGVPMGEVDFRTMESKKCAGLYLAGEILDVDGRIGGFNFQWAWATGYLAGRAAAQK
ncbi:MAG TPA: aminoacetone oxidase family FAD-binding enzyme [Tepidisphaeraceae bacterium]|nr:aminoacetone oxidase family FAD-binding enzyme [Tepidisphaeraceae bacterium]